MYIEYIPIELFDEPVQHLQSPATTINTGFGIGGGSSFVENGGGGGISDGFLKRKSLVAGRRCSEYSTLTTNSSNHIVGDGGSSSNMGFDIVAKIRKLLQFGNNKEDLNRKRRAEGDWNNFSQIKYRKVESEFPKIITRSFDEDDLNNVPQRINKAPLMAQRKQQIQNDKKSQFLRPKIITQHIMNTAFADIEFSDDDDDELILTNGRGECFNVVRQSSLGRPAISRPTMKPTSSPKVIHIPIKQRQPPPPLIEARTGDILASTLMPNLQPIRQPTYASILSGNTNGFDSVYTNTNKIGARVAPTSKERNVPIQRNTPLLFNGNYMGQLNLKGTRSIISQEHETKEHEQYSELLQKMIPNLYGLKGTSPKAPPPVKVLPVLNRSKPPLTIDLTLSDSGNRKKLADLNALPLEFSDDDISEIIDLADEELNILSACSKLQKDNAECSYDVKKRAAEKRKTLPYVEPVNSLKDRFALSPICKDDWLLRFQSKWEKKHSELKKELAETEKEVAERSAATRCKEKQMHERLQRLQIVDPDLVVIDDFPESDEEPELPELVPEHEQIIRTAVFGGREDQLLISKFNMNITRRDILTVAGKNWLNDEVINFYMNLLSDRSEKRQDKGLPKVYTMNTFFVPKLLVQGHSSVRRWTRKVDIFSYDLIPVPVHVGGFHWCMAIIHLRDRTIRYYDSMGTPNPEVLKALEQYLRDESLDKRKKPFDTSSFRIENVTDGPRQTNGCDCGVFSCMFAEYTTRDQIPTFDQSQMKYFRNRMILEIVSGALMQ